MRPLRPEVKAINEIKDHGYATMSGVYNESEAETSETSGWTETIQSMTATKRYLWTYQTITRVGGTSYDTDPVISGVWGDKGETGGKGDTGVSVTKVE